MARVTVTEAAHLVGLSRKTLYKHISKGKLSRLPGGDIETSHLLMIYGAFVREVTPKVSPKVTQGDNEKALGDRLIHLTEAELSLIIKGAVKAALLEAMPLLLENKTNAVTETTGDPIIADEPGEMMRSGKPFKKLDFSDIPSL